MNISENYSKLNDYILYSTSNELNKNYNDLKLWSTSIGKITIYPNLMEIFGENGKLKNKNNIDDELLKYMVDGEKLAKNKILIYTNNINVHKFATLMNEKIKMLPVDKRKELFKSDEFYKFIESQGILNECILEDKLKLKENENDLKKLKENENELKKLKDENELNKLKENENELKNYYQSDFINANQINKLIIYETVNQIKIKHTFHSNFDVILSKIYNSDKSNVYKIEIKYE